MQRIMDKTYNMLSSDFLAGRKLAEKILID